MQEMAEATTVLPLIGSPADTATVPPTIMDMWMSQLQKDHPEISFVIPSAHDNQHIDNMMSFKRLLEQVGNTAYDTIASSHQHGPAALLDSLGQPITHEQISQSAVLNMADVKSGPMSGLERFFAGSDMNSLINYLWIGVVTSLVILTVIFVMFSCYFYRKFREWKRCNKDIRAHLNNDMYPGTIVPCDPSVNPEAAYYQMDAPPPPPPPCYTIATGLPSYDEALHHHHQQFAFGMKFIYPALAAVHHQASAAMTSWEKYDMQNSKQQQKSSSSSPRKQQRSVTKCAKAAQAGSNGKSPASQLMMPPPYDVAASVALLAPEASESISIAMPEQQQQQQQAQDASAVPLAGQNASDLTAIITV